VIESKRERKAREKKEKQDARKARAYQRAVRVRIRKEIAESTATGIAADAFRSAL
jgi:hypothetical protein